MLHDCGFDPFTSDSAVTTVLKDISLPVSIHEVGLKRLWADLLVELLQLAFSNYYELLEVLLNKKRVSLEFSAVPDLSQLPPFILRKPSNRSNRWSQKVGRGGSLVGPVLPLPVLLTLNEYRNGCPDSHEPSGRASVEAEISRSCDEVMRVVGEQIVDDASLSLDNDGDGTWMGSQKSKPFLMYHPWPEAGGIPMGHTWGKYKVDNFVALIYKLSEKKHSSNDNTETIGLELFDDLYPVELRFDAGAQMVFEGKELKAYSTMEGEFLKWQNSFDLYEKFFSGIESKS